MKTVKPYLGLAILVTLFGFQACGSSDDNNNSSTGRSPTGSCSAESTEGEGVTCTGQAAYDACLQQTCGDEYAACLGPEYASGNYSGACQSEMECVLGCSCEDTNCAIGCYENASTDCMSCVETIGTCEENSGCTEPVCGSTGVGGAGGANGQGGATSTSGGVGGSTSSSEGGATSGGSAAELGGATSAGVCPYTTNSFDCTTACNNLRSIANQCETDPSLSEEIQAILMLASSGNGTACRTGCAASSPSAMEQWKCFQAVPTSADCTAIAGCTYANCPN